MAQTDAEKKEQLLKKLCELIEKRLPAENAPATVSFAKHYYAGVPPEDFIELELEDIYGAALTQWHFVSEHRSGSPAVRVFNPTFDEHSWQTTHTFISIVSDDMPFLVDSVIMCINQHGLTAHLIIHPVFHIKLDSEGGQPQLARKDDADAASIALMHCEVDRQTDNAELERLQNDLLQVLGDVRAAVEDWPQMVERMQEVIASLDAKKLPQTKANVAECKAFLEWAADNHFTFLGYRNYGLTTIKNQLTVSSMSGSGLGILRDDNGAHQSKSFSELPPALQQLACEPNLLIVSKANAKSTVHRPAHLDYLGIKRFNNKGEVIGEHRFLGLHTSLAYSMNPKRIPLLRSKIAAVMERTNLAEGGHASKALQNILDTFPRDDLFQASEDELVDIATGILHLQERQRLRLFTRKDPFERFVSCLVYVPRERYNTELRVRMEQILLKGLNGLSAEFNTQFSESVLARVQFHIRTKPGQISDFSRVELQKRLQESMTSWDDELHRLLIEQCGEERGNVLIQRYGSTFHAAYKADFKPRTAVRDVERLESVSVEQPLAMHLYRPLEDQHGLLRFKLYGPEEPTPLSQVLPMLEKLGLDVLTAVPYPLCTSDGRKLWILDFDMKQEAGLAVDVAQVKDIFQDAFSRVWAGAMENDAFNRLVLGARIAWRDVVMLRAYCKYLLQARAPFSQDYMQRTLNRHPEITRRLAELFHVRFDPDGEVGRGKRSEDLQREIFAALDDVSNLDEDRILRRFVNIIQATLRTNFFQAAENGREKDYISFKFDPAQITDLPLPRPMFEIFVYSTRCEGVHLRGGPVARGGLRWSDRMEDFRTEVLGLVKAQMVKNSVIVPVGSKGGFVAKQLPPGGTREETQQEVIRCYKTFICGLLDITDNRVGDDIVPPQQVVRFDSDDPYLVVAADKGTATFSDIANEVAISYGFWLGDAFASGGSVGYDHKKMAITARGAWESVKRQFRELGMDIQNRDDFTVVGIGDMAGDVFGNGMLLSRHIKLLAAFNHMHIFIDPDPDTEASFEERQRLFKLPRSSWEDYKTDLISAGGGIFSRSAKSIPLSAQARAALDIEEDKLTPNELINRLLRAPVDLLWNGGIGTYAKAHTESHADVGDKANDSLRVNGRDLRCKVIGEGGNLGFTQLGRIEYSAAGGRIFTDAVDNSAGVNCSDNEVNIKILLNQVVGSGDMTEKQRNELLASMTDEVADLVLRQNYLQPQAISITGASGADLLGDHIRVIRALESQGKLNRAIEFLPTDEELAEREANRQGLYAPELSVLLAYTKIVLFDEIIASDLPDDPYFQRELLAYFPKPLQERHEAAMATHPLRREIIATSITNSMLNRMGSSFAFRMQEDAGETSPSIARVYSAARQIFDSRSLWADIESLDNKVPADVQIQMYTENRHLIEHASQWLLRHRRQPLDIETVIGEFAEGVASLGAELPELLQGGERREFDGACANLTEAGVPEELAARIVNQSVMHSALDIVEVSRATQLPVEHVAAIYFALASKLDLYWLRESIAALPANNYWQRRARAAQLSSLYDQGRHLTAEVLRLTSNEDNPEQRLAKWMSGCGLGVERLHAMFNDLKASGNPDLSMLSVALRETANLIQGG